MVDCTCPDFRYRWAWANKQRGASRVGAQSLNQALNRAPRKPTRRAAPGLCKHIFAARSYIYGLLSSFPNDTPDTSDKLNKLTAFATKRWINFPQQMAAAKERDRLAAQARAGPQHRPGADPSRRTARASQDLPKDHEPARTMTTMPTIVPPDIADSPELQQVPPPPKSYADEGDAALQARPYRCRLVRNTAGQR
jgi:hypothetical protein